MICPLCNTEMRIRSSDYVLNDGKLFAKQIFTCRKKDCPNFDKDVKTVYVPLQVSEDTEAKSTEEQVTSTLLIQGAFFIPKSALNSVKIERN